MSVKIPEYLSQTNPNMMQRPPLEILQEAAQELKRQTRGLVEGTVFTLNPGGNTLFRYTFYLLVPSLNDYTDPLFYAWHNADFYPVTLLLAGGKQGTDDHTCHYDWQLEQELSAIFSNNDTTKRIQAMIALARNGG